jgi:tripartite-type tricarboxylate transporter receptor subunit TctC
MRSIGIFLILLFTATLIIAEDYPTKRVRIIEPFGAGGGVDVAVRPLAKKLSEIWSQEVAVENHPGKGSTAAPELVAKADPDGYTLLVSSSAQAYSAALSNNLPYDPINDFIPVAPLTKQSYVLITATSSGITTVQELIAAAKAKPGQLKFGSAGIATGSHLAAEKFNRAAGIKGVHIPAGATDSINDVISHNAAGETVYMIAPIPLSVNFILDGKIRALAVTGKKRSPLLSEIPTIAEAGVDEFDFSIWYGIWAPAKTPRSVIDKIAKDIATALSSTDLKEWLVQHGGETLAMTQSEFAHFVQTESDSAKEIIKASKEKP